MGSWYIWVNILLILKKFSVTLNLVSRFGLAVSIWTSVYAASALLSLQMALITAHLNAGVVLVVTV